MKFRGWPSEKQKPSRCPERIYRNRTRASTVLKAVTVRAQAIHSEAAHPQISFVLDATIRRVVLAVDANNGNRERLYRTSPESGDFRGGRLIVAVSKHMVAVVDGVIHDTSDCSRNGSR